jgi:phosphoribosylformimino-5-aminoimidazole carboxamide ribotide isomerase
MMLGPGQDSVRLPSLPAPLKCPAMHLFPAIDLREGKVVRLTQGDYDRQTTYGDDPVEQARRFADAGATWLHLVDLDGARSGKMEHLRQIEQICRQTSLKVEVGGGVRSEAAISKLLSIGVFRVVLGTAALRNWTWFESLMGNPTYRGRLVLGLDAREGKLAVSGWEQTTQVEAIDIARKVSDWPLAAIVYTDIATDGTLQGPNLDATRAMAEATHTPIVASGGVGTLEHLRQLRDLPIQGAIVGRALYEGTMTVDEALAVLERGA